MGVLEGRVVLVTREGYGITKATSLAFAGEGVTDNIRVVPCPYYKEWEKETVMSCCTSILFRMDWSSHAMRICRRLLVLAKTNSPVLYPAGGRQHLKRTNGVSNESYD